MHILIIRVMRIVIIAGLLINALFTGIAIDLMLSHGQNENNMKEITGVINE